MKKVSIRIPRVKKIQAGYIKSGFLVVQKEFKDYLPFLSSYTKAKFLIFSSLLESNKNVVVKSVLIKRGKRNRLFSHTSAMIVLSIGALISPFVSDSSLFAQDNTQVLAQEVLGTTNSLVTDDIFETEESEKPRDKIITYTVQNGDTISTIAKKFVVTEETIKWQNNLKNDRITAGDQLEILPVGGVAHKVKRGDTVYSIADKYQSNAQAIVDFPFNDFANPQTFSLVEGQIVIVPEGIKPEERPTGPSIVRKKFIATGPVSVTGAGFTWPVQGTLNQSYAWYHKAIDIGSPVGTPIVAAHSGTVSEVYTSGWHGGYGTHVIISGDNGYSTLYAHMSGVNVAPGDRVNAGGSVVGWIGLTGRTTGAHLHFEIRSSAGLLNPLSFL